MTNMIRAAFFDTKEYDKPSFERYGKDNNIEIKFFDTKLTEDTAKLAKGFDTVVVFVNDILNENVIAQLIENDVKLIALRCAGFNNVDLKYAKGKIPVVRVPFFSKNSFRILFLSASLILCVITCFADCAAIRPN